MNSKIGSCRTLFKSNWREETSKIVTHRRPPLQCRRYTQTTAINSQHPSPSGQHSRSIVALSRYNFVTCHNVSSGFKIWRHLPLFCRQWSLTTTTNEIVTTSKRLETASHGMETSKKWGLRSPTKSERNHNELFCRHQIFNMLKICQRTRRTYLAVCGRYRIRQRQLTPTHDDWR